jgi:hypothetical protein
MAVMQAVRCAASNAVTIGECRDKRRSVLRAVAKLVEKSWNLFVDCGCEPTG